MISMESIHEEGVLSRRPGDRWVEECNKTEKKIRYHFKYIDLIFTLLKWFLITSLFLYSQTLACLYNIYDFRNTETEFMF